MRHLTEEQLVAHHYGDADGPAEAAEIEQHLSTCAECQAQFEDLRRTLEVVETLPVPERSDAYGAEVWVRLQPRLERPVSSWRQVVSGLFVPRRLVLAGGVACLVLAAFVAGRYTSSTPGGGAQPGEIVAHPPAGHPEQIRERILLVAVGDHLERSQVALVELVNNSPSRQVDITSEQERARDLVSANRLYRQTAATTGEAGMADVLDELERVLVEIANSPSTMTAAEFERVRERIEAQGIIFKVRVLGQRVREREVRRNAGGQTRG